MSAFNVYNDVALELGWSFFVFLGNLSLCDRKHESDQHPERTQPKLIPLGEPRVKTPSVIAPTRNLYIWERCIFQ